MKGGDAGDIAWGERWTAVGMAAADVCVRMLPPREKGGDAWIRAELAVWG